jgi:hypothetical protein
MVAVQVVQDIGVEVVVQVAEMPVEVEVEVVAD